MEAYRQRWRMKIIAMMLLHRRFKLVDEARDEADQRIHRFWERPILQTRQTHGNWEHLIQELRLYDHETYFNFMRMTPQTFEEILSLVGSQLIKQTTNFREPICVKARLSLTIRYLATEDFLKSIALAFRIGAATASKIIRETCRTI